MAIETVAITEGVGTPIAVDEVAGTNFQVMKVALGADGAMDTLVDSGQQASSASIPVVGPSDLDGVATDAPADVEEDATARTKISLLKGIKNYLRSLASDIAAALAAGADIPVTLAPAAYGSKVSITRPADTTAYTAGDVIGIGTGAGGATAGPAALTFTAGPTAGGEVIITSAALRVDASAVPSGMGNFRLHLYNVTPPSALVDNAAWDLPSGDRASYLGYVDIGTPVDVGSTLFVQAEGINKQITLAGANLYGYLQTIGAYTPTSACVKSISLHTLRV